MKFVYTFWSKLPQKKDVWKNEDILSTIKIKYKKSFDFISTYYDNIDLVTDIQGSSILKDIPYSKIDLSLEQLSSFNNSFSTLPQIYALSLYDEPVCYVNPDFFAENINLLSQIINTQTFDVLVQSKSLSTKIIYGDQFGINSFLLSMTDHHNPLIKQHPELSYTNNFFYKYYCSILGFNNLVAKKKFVESCLKFFDYFNNNKIKHFETMCAFQKNRNEKCDQLLFADIVPSYFLSWFSNYHNYYVKELYPMDCWTNSNSYFQTKQDL